MTQADKVLKHVEQYGSIDSWTAIQLYDITRLAAVVHEINKTDKALKAIPHKHYKDASVMYIPDIPARLNNLRRKMVELSAQDMPIPDLANQLIEMASKFMVCHVRIGGK